MTKPTLAFITLFFATLISGCQSGPEAIVIGKDVCAYCKMTVSDVRFGGEIVTSKGKCYKFDDAKCLLNFMKESGNTNLSVKNIYFVNFVPEHTLIKKEEAFFIKTDSLKTPMGGNIAVFSSKEKMDEVRKEFDAKELTWDKLNKE
ncbi:MAG: nitrous oxide reductase accessory protein NosL [Chitinophagaceae bacterium]|nr:nitrous oxide reductase accessory protein NosL [Chitinophagaceae bacterium]